jgi:hypothetical protein
MQTTLAFPDDDHDDVNDIINQLKNQTNSIHGVEKDFEAKKITKEQMEDFVIQTASEVVQHSLEMVQELKRDAIASVDPNIINSVSSLVKATTSAIDSLTKLKIAEDKNKTQKEIAQMNIDSNSNKKDNDEKRKGLPLTRDEVFKFLTAGLSAQSDS